jgi:DNA gyrase subunit A
MAETIELAVLPTATKERYLRYALSVITARALPDVRDGLKPVQRRILYAMEADLGLGGGDAKHQKSAKVVGAVMGTYHPHGDQAIYEAMVRMAQDFSLRYALVDGQGNFGTIHGDPPAAFRYTECRLRGIASEVMSLLKEETVAFKPNYDSTAQEPVVLPAPAPFLLVNGASGIAVGMATNVPPHNLLEATKAAAHLVDEPGATVVQLLKHLKGPDFPTGGEVLTSKADLRTIYETGRGSVKVRGTYKIEEGARGRRDFVITSIPYGTTLDALILAIKGIIEGKKIPHAQDVRDETTEEDGLRVVIEMKRDSDPNELAAYLFKHTPLQENYGVNLTALVPTENPLVGRPEVLDLKKLLRHFLDFRFSVVTKSFEFRLRKLRERLHILEGFAKVFGNLDQALKIVRAADDKADAQAKLMKKFGLDAVQTDAILEQRIYKLARLEIEAIRAELSEKTAEAQRIAKLLKSEKGRWKVVKDDLVAFGEKFGDKRRTRLVLSDEPELAYDADAYIAKEDTNVLVTLLGFVKRVRSLKDPQATRVREGDSVGWILQGSTRATGVFFSNQGSAYVAKLNDAPQTTGYGDPIQKLFKFGDGEKVVAAFSLDVRVTPAEPSDGGAIQEVVVVTAAGLVQRTALGPHREVSTRAGRKFARLGEGDEVVAILLVSEKSKHLLLLTQKGMGHRFALADVPVLAGVGKGVRGIKLEKGDRVTAAAIGAEIKLETTRGAVQELATKTVALGERGEPGTVVLQRGGFVREVLEPRLVELAETEGEKDHG